MLTQIKFQLFNDITSIIFQKSNYFNYPGPYERNNKLYYRM